jgi:hypothetical protein
MRASFFLLASLLTGCGPEAPAEVVPPTFTSCAAPTPWALSFDGPIASRRTAGRLALDASCNVLLTGQTDSALVVGGATVLPAPEKAVQFAAKVGPDGKLAWVSALGAGATGTLAVAALASGDAVVAGTLQHALAVPGGALDGKAGRAFVARLDGGSGAILWAKLLPADPARSLDVGVEVGDRVVVAGSFSGSPTLEDFSLESQGAHDVLVARLDGAGQLLSLSAVGGAGDDAAEAIAVDRAGGLYLAGSTGSPTSTDTTPWVARLGADDAIAWEANPGLPGDRSAATSLAVDAHGDLLTVHAIQDGERLSRWSPLGLPLGTPRDITSATSRVRSDAAAAAYLSGFFRADGLPDLGGGPLHAGVSGRGTYVAKLDRDFAHVYSKGLGSGNPSSRGDLVVDAAGGVWMLINYTLSFTHLFGAVPLPVSAGAMVVLRLTPEMLAQVP